MTDKRCAKTGFYPADILLPKDADMSKWSVVACDQFTSQPEYWEKADKIAGDSPSALRIILPEVKLTDPNVEDLILAADEKMEDYIVEDIFKCYENSVFYIERTQSDGAVRRGIIGMIDLECYDFSADSKSLIRATEQTVLERIPPRVKVRKDALIELPHIMLLMDDAKRSVIEPLAGATSQMEPLYDFDLMLGGGKLKGFKVSEAQQNAVLDALSALADTSSMLFAVGDGNHSLATAKQCYENEKRMYNKSEWANLKSRFALVEIVNLYDEALKFEPIHRVLFKVKPKEVLDALLKAYPGSFIGKGKGQQIEYCFEGEAGTITVPKPSHKLEVGTLQIFLDDYLKKNGGEIDYIHGDEVVRELGSKPGNMGFLLPPMPKESLFPAVTANGALPRKTFSMGHAEDKRYYTEARYIKA